MENKEYYTPEIDELFIGYKCQRRVTKPNYVEKYLYEWRDYTLDEHYFSAGYEEGQDWNYYEVELRTHYLCKQDIIDLGWIDTEYGYFDISPSNTDDYLHRLRFLNDKNRDGSPSIEIIFIGAFDRSTVFYGKCKSKNELKKLMKDYLNIPI